MDDDSLSLPQFLRSYEHEGVGAVAFNRLVSALRSSTVTYVCRVVSPKVSACTLLPDSSLDRMNTSTDLGDLSSRPTPTT
jgi:hypothetical protein